MRAVLLGISFLTLFFMGCTNKNILKGSVEQTSNVNLEDDYANLPLHDAIRAKDTDAATLLINASSQLNTQDEYGYTPLHLSSIYNQVKTAELLIQKGANVNTQDNYEDTPLIDASRNNYYKMSRLLVCNNAQRNAIDKNGITPLHYASQAKNSDLIELLLTNEFDVFCQDSLEIALNTIEDTTQTSLSFCGTLKEGVASSIDVAVSSPTSQTEEPIQTLPAMINKEEKRWCTQPSEPLALGTYTLKATAKDKADHVSEATMSFNIIEKVIEEVVPAQTLTQNIYEALNSALKDDLEKWNASLDPLTLTLSFHGEDTFFKRGFSQVPQAYEAILAEFLPQYIQVLKPYEGKIKVLIQGHTSSLFESATDEKIKFMKNEILSQKRAQNVYEYLKDLNSEEMIANTSFINNDVQVIAKASLETIKNPDMSEDYASSRRVDFKVEVLDESVETLPEGIQIVPPSEEELLNIEEIDLLQ